MVSQTDGANEMKSEFDLFRLNVSFLVSRSFIGGGCGAADQWLPLRGGVCEAGQWGQTEGVGVFEEL